MKNNREKNKKNTKPLTKAELKRKWKKFYETEDEDIALVLEQNNKKMKT